MRTPADALRRAGRKVKREVRANRSIRDPAGGNGKFVPARRTGFNFERSKRLSGLFT